VPNCSTTENGVRYEGNTVKYGGIHLKGAYNPTF